MKHTKTESERSPALPSNLTFKATQNSGVAAQANAHQALLQHLYEVDIEAAPVFTSTGALEHAAVIWRGREIANF